MKTLFCKVFSLAVLGMLMAAPAVADDLGVFRIDQAVLVGSAELPAGVYVFRASDRGHVLVYDESQTKVVAAALTRRDSLKLAESEMSGTLSHDRAIRAISLGEWRYSFAPSEKTGALASGPTLTTVIALAR